MFYKYYTNWKLLAKFMAGEANPEEIAALEEWRKAKPTNNELFQQLKSDWKNMDQMNARFDVDKAWNRLNNKITAESPETTPTAVKSARIIVKHWLTPMRIAASFLLFALIGGTLLILANKVETIQITATVDEPGKSYTLPDGSVVELNSDAKLRYSKKFGKNNREIILIGEAFFDIKHDQSKPFVIQAGDARIRVLGTSFNVNANTTNKDVEVFVTSGLVELSEKRNEDNRQLIQPGNIGILHNKEITVAPADENSLAWKTGVLVFNETPLDEAIVLLGKFYKVPVVLKGDGMDAIKIVGDYTHDDPLDSIIQIIAKGNPQLVIKKLGDTYYLSQD